MVKNKKEEKIERKGRLKIIKEQIKKAKKGDSVGYYRAALEYSLLKGKKNLKRSLKLYEKGARKNEPNCLFELGYIYSNGYNYKGIVTTSRKIATDYFYKAQKYGNAKACYYLGKFAEEEKRYKVAYDYYKEAYNRGYSSAKNEYTDSYKNMNINKKNYPNLYYWVKWMYFGIYNEDERCMKEAVKVFENGYCNGSLKIEKDIDEAFSIHEKLAEKNDCESILWLADYYEEKENFNEAFIHYSKLVEIEENGYAFGKIGDYYYNGRAISTNYNRAISYFEKGAKLNDPLSLYGLGKCYYYGYGDKQNYTKSIEYFKIAVTCNYSEAYLYLGLCFYNGFGVEQNYDEALSYFLKASSLDVKESYKLIGDCFFYGYGTDINYEKALNWYLNAVENAQKINDYNIAFCYLKKDTKNDYKKAIKWYLKAIEGPEKELAYNDLGFIYGSDKINKPDYEKAHYYYNEAYKLGNSCACFNLGCLYYKGLGVNKNIKEAIKYFEEASSKNYLDAKKVLVEIYKEKEFYNEKKLMVLNEELANQNDENAMYVMGLNYLKNKNIEKGLDLIKRASELGSTNAMVELANFYINKKYGLDDLEKGKELYSNATKKGNAIAKLNLGIILKNEGKYNSSIKMLSDKDLSENAQALCLLGEIYENGLGVSYDLKKAYEYYVKASELNSKIAYFKLGYFYTNGIYVQKNINQAIKYYVKATELGLYQAFYNLGYIYKVRKEFKKAFECFKIGASKEDPLSMYALGIMYHNGEGTEASDVKAKELCTKASKENNDFVDYLIGLTYYEGNDIEKNDELAYKWFMKSAKKNNIKASFYIGYFYQTGTYVKKDIKKAINYYQKSIETNSTACLNLSLIYRDEDEFKDVKKSFDYALKAYNLGNIYSSYILGEYYENGICVSKDLRKAFAFYNSGALKDDVQCQKKVANFYYDGIGVDRNYSEAYKWYLNAYNNGDESVIYDIGWCLYNGQGTPRKYDEAFKWFKKGSELGNENSAFQLAVCYYSGNGTKIDYKKAFEIFNKYIDLYNEALYYLGCMYADGLGVVKNTKKAKELFLKSAKLDDIDSIKCLINIYKKENNLVDMFYWYTVLAQKNDPEGTFMTGICYEFGYGVTKNIDEALKYYRKAKNLEYPEAFSRIGDIYINGEFGEIKNEQVAFDLFKDGTKLNDPYSIYSLAFCYDYGKGTIISHSSAIYYYRKFLEFKNLDEVFNKIIDTAKDRLRYLEALQCLIED